MPYPKRLIEVDLPIKRISAHARREKSIRHGHISTLHIWWARRPLAACRAVLCASLWPDPSDPLCPKEFIEFAQSEMIKWSDNEHLPLLSKESVEHFIKVNHDKKLVENKNFLRILLLDFIADFANWDNSDNKKYLETTQSLTSTAHTCLNDNSINLPITADPFAGGGSIPLEAIRVGSEAFASDLNPIPVLINKLQLEIIPKYKSVLLDKLEAYGNEFKKNVSDNVREYYPKSTVDEKVYAYLWARSIKCEGPNCGIRFPLLKSTTLSKRKNNTIGLLLSINKSKINIDVVKKEKGNNFSNPTIKRGNATCPCCGYVTAVQNIRKQLTKLNGGANDSIIYAVVTTNSDSGKNYRSSTENDYFLFEKAKNSFHNLPENLKIHEPLPLMSGVFNAPIYGHSTWGSLFNNRQGLLLANMVISLEELSNTILQKENDKELARSIILILSFAIDRCANSFTSLSKWNNGRELVDGLFARQAIPMLWDYGELNYFSNEDGYLENALHWIKLVIMKNPDTTTGTSLHSSADQHPLADDSVDLLATDPPYYNAVPYADLSDFFYVWLKRSLKSHYPQLFEDEESPKANEICEMAGWDSVRYSNKDADWFESKMKLAMLESRRILKPNGIGVVVFAHKTTTGWEAQLQAMLNAGWIFTGSWPIDTEMGNRLRASNSAALASSVHLVCRPRENEDGSLIQNQIGDWRDVQQELPKRIHEWMPRLAAEGVAGADAIFACLGPALEIFSRFSSVEKPNGDIVTLREYLEKVWAAVSQEALNMVFTGGEAQGLEEDARLTAMWLWTLTAGASDNTSSVEEEDVDEEESGGSSKLTGGFTLEYDTARKIAQGLGANLEELKALIEVKGDKARLLPVLERTNKLFGSAGIQQQPVKKKKKVQLSLTFENIEPEEDSKFEMPELKVEQTGKTVLDRLHQAMLLFSTGRTEALKRFLVEDGVGKDDRFWKLAQSLTSLYPKDTDERRWVEAVQTYKKSLGF